MIDRKISSLNFVFNDSRDSMRAITLVVDDAAEVRKLLSRGLTQAGYEVRLANDGASALAVLWALQGRVDVVLTDIRMPGEDVAA